MAESRRGLRSSQRLTLSWSGPDNPLPRQEVRAVGRSFAPAADADVPPWIDTGPVGETFDFGERIRLLCADIAARCEVLRHIEVGRILVAITQARNGCAHGLQARVTPLRFPGGALQRRHGGVRYQVQRVFVGGREMLYLMTFCLPRFLNQSFDDKLVTLFHELYHIGPRFDGDLRRHEGRYAVHSHSQKGYDRKMAGLARDYLAGGPDPALHAFLRLSFVQLRRRHGRVVGAVVPRPKLVPVVAGFHAPFEELHAAVRNP